MAEPDQRINKSVLPLIMTSIWNLPPPPGFQGLRDDLPLSVYVRHLPHWRQEGATYFTTFRLGDSLPQAKLNELRRLQQQWQQWKARPHTAQALDQLSLKIMRKVEKWLDQGMGRCALRSARAAKAVVDAMHFFDGQRYELGAYVIMPNHVHAIVRPLWPKQHDLEHITQSWKRHSARQINKLLHTSGSLWQQESFDRIIRDEENLYRSLRYIVRNPEFAGLSPNMCPLWIRSQWVELKWDGRGF